LLRGEARRRGEAVEGEEEERWAQGHRDSW
jgi:hypothetical protein